MHGKTRRFKPSTFSPSWGIAVVNDRQRSGRRLAEMEIGFGGKQMGTAAGGGEREGEESGLRDYNSEIKREKLRSMLADLLADPILADVPRNPTLSEVVTLVSLEKGSAIRLSVVKLDGSSLDVAVMNSATVKDLKLVIKKKVNETEQANLGHRKISWKHVWSNFCLSYHNEKLLDDNAVLQDFGIRNNSQVSFMPYVMKKGPGRHSKRRKHRLFRGLNKTA